MKKRLIIRFLICNFIIIHIAFAIYIMMNLMFMNKDISFGEDIFNVSFRSSDFTDRVLEEIKYSENIFSIDDKLRSTLIENNIWLQIIDGGNNELFNVNKPTEVPSQYLTGDLVKYTVNPWRSPYPSTLCVRTINVESKAYTLILGLPIDKVVAYKFVFTDESFMFHIYMVLFTLVLMLIVAYLFSRSLATPIAGIVDDIKRIKKGKYNKKNKSYGIYKSVNKNIAELSMIINNSKVKREEIDKAKEEWIANIAHDLNTPLSSVKGYAELLTAEDYKITVEDANRYGKIILDKSQYIQELIEDLSLIYKLKNKVLPFKIEEKNLVKLTREVVIDILNNPIFSEKEINIDYNNENIIILCDEKYLKRALNNFIVNALVHNPSDTIVNINTNTNISSGTSDITIEDNGQGINKDDLDNIFNRYYRGSNTEERHKGSGLGMAISKELVEGNGAKLTVESIVGKGTAIKLQFKTMKIISKDVRELQKTYDS